MGALAGLITYCVKQTDNFLFLEQHLVREQAMPVIALEPFAHWNEEKRPSNPVRGVMFIERELLLPPAPFGGAELKLTGTKQVPFRSSKRRGIFVVRQVYKHLAPDGVKPRILNPGLLS